MDVLLRWIARPLVRLVQKSVFTYISDWWSLHSGTQDKLKELEGNLKKLGPVIRAVADEVEVERKEYLNELLMNLKDAFAAADQVVSEFEYLHLKHEVVRARNINRQRARVCRRQVSLPPTLSSLLALPDFTLSVNLLENLDTARKKLADLLARPEVSSRLRSADTSHPVVSGHGESSSFISELELAGGQELIVEEIIKKLQEDLAGVVVPVLPLVGYGGMGKTTLAQHVFNREHFDKKIWLSVSANPDVRTLTKKMIQAASETIKFSDGDTLEMLQKKLVEALGSELKSLLLVLDDVWYDGDDAFTTEQKWEELRKPLVAAAAAAATGGKRFRILLTSRTLKYLPGALDPVELQGLEENECWSIIKKQAIAGRSIRIITKDLVKIGKQIAAKVKGSPLAAKAIGGILRNKLDSRHWTDVLNTELSDLGGDTIMPVLKLSYQHLPFELRRCFAYCSLFPKGHSFSVEFLVRVWVAQGFITTNAQQERTAEDYFHELLSKAFFTPRQMHGIKDYVMHDLMNDLARSVSRDVCVCIHHGRVPTATQKTVRHVSVRADFLSELLKRPCNLGTLQTLIIFRGADGTTSFDGEGFREVLTQMQRLRVLDFHGCDVSVLPKEIGSCVHLRYLDISHNCLVELPSSICRLYHLQVLNANGNYCLRGLPARMSDLIRLRSLEAKSRYPCLSLAWVGKLASAQVLRGEIQVARGKGHEMGNMKDLDRVFGGWLQIWGLENIESGDQAKEAGLNCKDLMGLFLGWKEPITSQQVAQEDVIEALQPPASLNWMKIVGYSGTRSPSWMCDSLLPKLEYLEIEGFPFLESLVECLPRLKVLIIKSCPMLRSLPPLPPSLTDLKLKDVGLEFLPGLLYDDSTTASSSSSSGLIRLAIEGCRNLTSLGEGLLLKQQRLRRLEMLSIKDCMELVHLPDVGFRELVHMKRLSISGCPRLTWASGTDDPQVGDQCSRLFPSSLVHLSLSPPLPRLRGESMQSSLPPSLESLSIINSCVEIVHEA